MYSLALFIAELQTASRRLIRIFQAPDGTSKERPRNPPDVQRAEIARKKNTALCSGCFPCPCSTGSSIGWSRERYTAKDISPYFWPNGKPPSLERLLGLRINLAEFYRLAAVEPKLDTLAQRFHGLKPPRFPTVFEALANAIACQQMSLSLGILLLNRITEKFGIAVEGTAGPAHAFPRPEDLADQERTAFRQLGFSRQKGLSLIALARTCIDERIDLETLADLNNKTAVERLLALRGIGRWSAEYVLLRGLGRLNVYPGDDVGARNNLRSWLKLRKPLDYEGVHRITAKWQPYAGFIYFHLLLDRLDAAGHLAPKSAANQL